MFKLLLAGFLLLSFNIHATEIKEDPVYNRKKYQEAGQKDAKKFMEEYLQLEKPKFQRAYKTYQGDLEKIFLTGEPPHNEELYKDLLQMNSEEPFIYRQTKHKGNLYKKYKY